MGVVEFKPMNIEVVQIGDVWCGDFFVDDRIVYGPATPVWTAIAEPYESINRNLAPADGDPTCIVLAVEYADKSRGSRIYVPGTRILVRRPS